LVHFLKVNVGTMAEIKTEQEPSIEEILESIRQIISEDGTPVAAEQPAKPAAAKAPPPAAEPPKPAATAKPPQPPQPPQSAQPVQPAQTAHPVQSAPPAAAAPAAKPAQPPAKTPAPEPVLDLTDRVEETSPERPSIVMEEVEEMESAPLMSEMTEEAAVAAMARILAQNLAVDRELPGKPGSLTLEDIVREIMHPLIKVWLDKNLPVIIEKLVAREIEKLSHRAMDKS
jgi:uncharacterized protein